MVNKSLDTTLRITRKSKESLDILCDKEGLSVKDCVARMVDFFLKSKVSVKEEFVSPDKVGERIIKIIRNQEKLYFEPLLRQMNRVVLFQDNLITETDIFDSKREENTDTQGMNRETEPVSAVSVEPDRENQKKIESLTIANALLAEQIMELINPATLTKKQGVGEVYYIRKMTEEQIADIRKNLEKCTIR